MSTSCTPVFPWMRTIKRLYDENSLYPFVSQPTFTAIWTCFIQQQDWIFDLFCPFCDRTDAHGEVDFLNYDAICLGIKKSQASIITNPTTVHDESNPIRKFNLQSNRFILNFKLRKLYQRWAVNTFGSYKRENASKFPKLTNRELKSMKTQLSALEQNNSKIYESLVNLIDWCDTKLAELSSNEEKHTFISEWKNFIRAIGTNEPVYQIAHPQIRLLLQKTKNEILDENNKNTLMKYSPVLGFLVYNTDVVKPECFWYLLNSLGSRCDFIMTKLLSKRRLQDAAANPTEDVVALHNDFETSGSYYSATYKRQRPMYAWDTVKISREIDTKCGMLDSSYIFDINFKIM